MNQHSVESQLKVPINRSYLWMNLLINGLINIIVNALFGMAVGQSLMPLYGSSSIFIDILWTTGLISFLVGLTVSQNTRKDFFNAKVEAPTWRRQSHVLLKYLPNNDYLRALCFLILGLGVFPLVIMSIFWIFRITELNYTMFWISKGLYGGLMASGVDVFARIPALGDQKLPSDSKFHPYLASIKQHSVPKWFEDGKLGIFVHWGLYSVPAYAHVDERLLNEIAEQDGIEEQFKKTPYAEWYLNTMNIEGSSTQDFHKKTYGKDFPYDNFIPQFNEAAQKWNPNEWADLFQQCGAKYVVLTTKHCDGYLLWPSKHPNPMKSNYMADRDIVGELTTVVESKGMKMGFYYSSCWDWTFNTKPITDIISFLSNGPSSKQYRDYVYAQWTELIEQYNPSILWSDIGYPHGTNVNELFAHYYNHNPEGVVNDRWIQTSPFFQKIIQFQPFSALVKWISKKYVKNVQTTELKPPHFDYITPEYKVMHEIQETKWETCRGIGRSFGINQFEPESNYLSTEELIYLLIDVVSKNGNLLLNIGPNADGSISDIQQDRLKGLGRWLTVNGEAIFGTHPWERAEGKTTEGLGIRFTQKDNIIYTILLGTPNAEKLELLSISLPPKTNCTWMGEKITLNWTISETNIIIDLPKNLPESEAHVIKFELPIE